MRDSGQSWVLGGHGEIFQGVTWETRPETAGSGAPEDLQRAWLAVVCAIQQELGALRPGSCFLLNLAAAPLVQKILGVPVHACAGYACFAGPRGRFESGFRWAPLVYWPKSYLSRHPRDVGARRTVLTWRDPDALEMVLDAVGDVTAMLALRALINYDCRGDEGSP